VNFVWFIIVLVLFEVLFWHYILMIVGLPGMAAMPLLLYATENSWRKWVKWVLLPVATVLAFIFGTGLIAFVYGGTLALIARHFAENSSYPWIYWGICGIAAFYIMAPSGETNLLAMFLSLGSFLAVVFSSVVTGVLGLLLGIVVGVIQLVVGIGLVVLLGFGIWKICDWSSVKMFSKEGIIDTENRLLRTQFGDVETELRRLNKWTIWWRYVGAFFIFIIYWLTLWGTFRQVGTTLLDYEKAKILLEAGLIKNIWEYGWGEHYVWFLIAICLVTFWCAALSGATAKKNGSIIASVSNICIVLGLGTICYLHYNHMATADNPVAWGIVLPLSMVGSILSAVFGGIAGEKFQEAKFPNHTIFGIRPFHWSWIWLISHVYLTAFLGSLYRFIAHGLLCDLSFMWFILSLFVWVPVLAYGYPIFLMYNILSGRLLTQRNVMLKLLSFVGICIGGLAGGGIIELACWAITRFIYNLFS